MERVFDAVATNKSFEVSNAALNCFDTFENSTFDGGGGVAVAAGLLSKLFPAADEAVVT